VGEFRLKEVIRKSSVPERSLQEKAKRSKRGLRKGGVLTKKGETLSGGYLREKKTHRDVKVFAEKTDLWEKWKEKIWPERGGTRGKMLPAVEESASRRPMGPFLRG